MRYTCILYLYIYSEIYLYFQWYVCIIFYKFLPRCQYIYCIFVQVVHRDVSKLSEMFLRIFTEIIVYLFRLFIEIFLLFFFLQMFTDMSLNLFRLFTEMYLDSVRWLWDGEEERTQKLHRKHWSGAWSSCPNPGG